MSFLEIRELTKTYPHSNGPCIEGMDFSMEKGEITVILGPSGCGKSTLLRAIAGLERYEHGTISIDGECMNGISPEKRPVSMVFQKAYLFPNMNVAKNVNYAPRLNSTLKGKELEEETERMLSLVDMEGYGDRKVTELSGGQEQRVSLARALITRPKLLLLDEPFSALDAKLRISMRASLRRICKEIGQTVIFVTHDQQEAVAIADRIALMMDGKILQYDRPDVFYHRPKSYDSAMFFGWKNAVPARKQGNTITSAFGEYIVMGDGADEGDVMLMIHPQAAICTPQGRYEGLVKEAEYLGTISDYTVECNGVELRIEVSCRVMHLVGEMMRFDLDMTMMWPVNIKRETPADKVEAAPMKKGFLQSLRSRMG